MCGKNSGEKGAAHEGFWKSVEGASKLWPLICTQLGVKHHKVRERNGGKKIDQFLELTRGWNGSDSHR